MNPNGRNVFGSRGKDKKRHQLKEEPESRTNSAGLRRRGLGPERDGIS